MHVSLTQELEDIIKRKVASGLYNNASEVIREALRFMEGNEELIYQIKLDRLRAKLAEGERDMEEGRFKELSREEIGPFFVKVKEQALGNPQPESR
ncbi:MAG: type II toxin-antitoxin system ParD family antitoxin [Gammaproteobacteria bacterium]